jgi:hypothetical protein
VSDLFMPPGNPIRRPLISACVFNTIGIASNQSGTIVLHFLLNRDFHYGLLTLRTVVQNRAAA